MTPIARRSVLGGLAASVLAGGAAPAVAAGPSGAGSAAGPSTIALPDGFRPEGITSGPGRRFYTGSLAGLGIWAGDLRTGDGAPLTAGGPGQSLRGMQVDPRSGLLWVAGSEGATGVVLAYRARDGELVRRYEVAGAGFLNDLVVTRGAVWVTDSAVDVLTRVSLRPGGAPGSRVTRLELGGAWPATAPGAFGANGIRELDDDTLVLNNSTAGGLWAVSKSSGAAHRVEVRGGPDLVGGDGLERQGSLLFDVRASGDAVVDVLRLRRTLRGWTARWLATLTDPGLDVPSTATAVGRSLYAVNARFGVPDPDAASYTVTRLTIRIR